MQCRTWTMIAGLALALTSTAAASPHRPESGTPDREVLLRLLAPGERVNPPETTVEAARGAVAARPHDADAWHALGETLEVAGRIEEAVAAYRRATALPPRVIGRAYLQRDLAAALERTGDFDGALAAARIAVRSWPLSRDGPFCGGAEVRLLVRLLVRTGDLDNARAFHRPLAEARPDLETCRQVQAALDAAS